MTYCLGILLDEGLVMASDTRTSAGVDNIASFSKMRVWEKPGERVLVLLSAGNLAVTQTVVSELEAQVRTEDDTKGGLFEADESPLMQVPGMFRAAQTVGEALRRVHKRDAKALKAQGASFSATFLLGGQIKGGPLRLFLIYSAGNFIEATADTPFFQAGETKYGKPILDRVIGHDTSMMDAVKCALVSFDSTMRSNLSVGLPIDLVCVRAEEFGLWFRRRLTEGDPYMSEIRHFWAEGLRDLFGRLPAPPFAEPVKGRSKAG